MPYSLLISLTDLPRSLSSNIYRLNSFVYRFCFKTIFPVLLYNLLYFYPYLLSQILYQIQMSFAFDIHIIQWYSYVFGALGFQAPAAGYDLFLPEDSIRRAEGFLGRLPRRPNIIVNMFGSSRYRCLCDGQIKAFA